MKSLKKLLFVLLPVLFLFFTVSSAHASTVLGGMDLNGWCASQNEGAAALNSSNQWTCSGNNQVIDFTTNPTPNCVWQYKISDAFATNQLTPTDPNYKYAWQCSTNNGATPTPTPTATPTPTGTITDLGGMTLDQYCQHINNGVGYSFLNANNQWACTASGQIIDLTSNPTPACVWQYNISNAYAQELTPGSVYSYNCFVNGAPITGTPTPTPTTGVTPTPTATPTPTPSVTDDWTMLRYNLGKSSYNNAETILNVTSLANLKQDLDIPTATQGALISDAPAVVNNVMYYGDWKGNFYARNVKDGSIVWTRNIGVDTPPAASHCNPASLGVASSPEYRAITINGVSTPAIFIAGGDGNLYALKASDGSIIWKTQLTDITTGGFLWDSPALYNGSVYEGLASFGDCPLVQGKMFKLNWTTGAIQTVLNLVPNGCIGAGEWASPTIDTGNNTIYITTGTNDDQCQVNGKATVEPNALAVIELDLNLNILGSWRIPVAEQIGDSDFGVSPALATTTINGVKTQIVEAANKNGHVYFFKRGQISQGPYADINLGIHGGGNSPDGSDGTIATGASDGTTIYQAMGYCSSLPGGPTSNCEAPGFNSAIVAMNPATGATIWKTPIAKQIVSTPILLKDSIIVFTGNNIELLRKSDGSVIKTLTPPGGFSVFDGSGAVARGMIFTGNLNGNFYEFGL